MDTPCSWPGVVVEVVVVAFSVDLDGVLDELCRRSDRNEGMRDELRAFGWRPSSKQAPLRPYRPCKEVSGTTEVRVVKCRRPMDSIRLPFKHWAKLVRDAEVPRPTRMASMTTEYVALVYVDLPLGVDLYSRSRI